MYRITILMAFVLALNVCHAATIAFTYQGQLKDNNAPVTGSVDFTFALFDAAAAGTQIGTTQTRSGVAVTGGLFTVELDFGAPAFGGADRFLEIAAKASGAASFTTFSTRQKLTPAPYAVFAQNAGTAASVPASGLPIAGTTIIGAVYADGTTIMVAADGKLSAAGGPPSGPAGGDLTGTYPNPTVVNLGAISGANLINLNGSSIASGTVPTARLDTGTGANQLVKLDGTARLPAVDGSQLTNSPGTTGTLPVGAIIAWHKSFPNTPPLPSGFVECNGQVLSDASSPYNGQTIPNLNAGNRFLRGSSTSGATGGSETHANAVMIPAGGPLQMAGGSTIQPTNHLPPYFEVVWYMRIK